MSVGCISWKLGGASSRTSNAGHFAGQGSRLEIVVE